MQVFSNMCQWNSKKFEPFQLEQPSYHSHTNPFEGLNLWECSQLWANHLSGHGASFFRGWWPLMAAVHICSIYSQELLAWRRLPKCCEHAEMPSESYSTSLEFKTNSTKIILAWRNDFSEVEIAWACHVISKIASCETAISTAIPVKRNQPP